MENDALYWPVKWSKRQCFVAISDSSCAMKEPRENKNGNKWLERHEIMTTYLVRNHWTEVNSVKYSSRIFYSLPTRYNGLQDISAELLYGDSLLFIFP